MFVITTSCNVTIQFTEENLHRRTPAEYNYHCSLLQGPLASADSTTYGINYCSPLNNIKGFHAAGGQIPQDIMHVLFEGALHLEVQLMLKHFLNVEHYFTLGNLNARIEHFSYSRTEARNKAPKSFTSGHITGSGKLPLSGMVHNYSILLQNY